MSGKEKIRMLVTVLGIVGLLFVISDPVMGHLVIEDLFIEGIDPREGCLDWRNQGNQNATGKLTIDIDGIVVLQKGITSDIHWVTGRLINPKEWEYFDLNETEGSHLITVKITSDTGNSSNTLAYEGWGIWVEEEDEEEEEDWLPCPSSC